MTAPGPPGACSHCLLPLGRRPMERTVNGEPFAFCCYGCCIAFEVRNGKSEEWDAAWLLVRLGVGAFLSMNIMLISLLIYSGAFGGQDAWLLPWIRLLLWIFATPALLILGGPFLRDAWVNALGGQLTASALIVIGVAAAYLYSALAVIGGNGGEVYFDTATMVLMLFTLGSYLEAAARARAARDLEPLLAAERELASIVDGEEEIRRPVREVAAGMLVRIRPGERIPVDGIVVEGQSHSNEAIITGESRQIAKAIGSPVIAGSINIDGPLLVRATDAGTATRWARICQSVRDALSRRGPMQRIADIVVGVSVPLVLILGALTVLYWVSYGMPFHRALLIGLAVLVVACPCAVGLAAPLAISLGIGRLARCGCLVRDPAALEALAATRLLAFDKTGTLTLSKPRIVAIESEAGQPDDVLARAAGLERYSEHGLARAIVMAAAARGLEPVETSEAVALPGRGIWGRAHGQAIAAGNGALMDELNWAMPPTLDQRAQSLAAGGHTVIHVGWDGRVEAVLALDDTPLPETRWTIEALRRQGLAIALLTGDLDQAARRFATAVGIGMDEIETGLLPEAKRTALENYRRSYGVVAMVGDGLNDGPVLADADVGIAVGSATDLARETSALVLPPGGVWMLPWVISLARQVRRTILANLAWAFGYNLVALTLAALGLLQPVLAAAIMASSSVLLIVNSLRLTRLPDPVLPPSPPLPDLTRQSIPTVLPTPSGASTA
jgi:heavy metal translocating P-type ATPase